MDKQTQKKIVINSETSKEFAMEQRRETKQRALQKLMFAEEFLVASVSDNGDEAELIAGLTLRAAKKIKSVVLAWLDDLDKTIAEYSKKE